MTHRITIDEWWLDDDHQLVVELVEYTGRWRFDTRVWFREEDGSMRAGRNGLALGVRHLERLTAATEKAYRGAVGRFLIAPARATTDAEVECGAS